MTPDQIETLERLEREATPGPWSYRTATESECGAPEVACIAYEDEEPLICGDPPDRGWGLEDCDGALIAAARNALPSLLDSARDLAALRAKVEALAGEWEQESERRLRDAEINLGAIRTALKAGARFERAHAARLRALLPGGDADGGTGR